MHVVGTDLSGPVNIKNTAMVVYGAADGHLEPAYTELQGVSNCHIYTRVGELLDHGPVIVGVDAAL
ncbi:MAG: hypothetical protein ACLFWB_05850 [Armatimonadota bacterium]